MHLGVPEIDDWRMDHERETISLTHTRVTMPNMIPNEIPTKSR